MQSTAKQHCLIWPEIMFNETDLKRNREATPEKEISSSKKLKLETKLT